VGSRFLEKFKELVGFLKEPGVEDIDWIFGVFENCGSGSKHVLWFFENQHSWVHIPGPNALVLSFKKLENHITLVVSHKWVDCSDGPPNLLPNLNPIESKLQCLDHLLYHAPPVTCSPNVMHEIIQEDNKHHLELPVAVHYQWQLTLHCNLNWNSISIWPLD
jgi:hypothetical protein